jgi:SET domain-containing protein 6
LRLTICASRSTFSIETDLKLPDELVSAIRAFLLTPEEYAKAQKKESPPKPKLDAVSAKWARKALEHRLGEYKTSIAVSLCSAI